ncbi:unnamed protein product [Closterium sp. Naga37s-1]|nr:unnamed protein product [Closterium sp. Naga37s-1]
MCPLCPLLPLCSPLPLSSPLCPSLLLLAPLCSPLPPLSPSTPHCPLLPSTPTPPHPPTFHCITCRQLHGNSFTGSVPATIGQLTNLLVLSVPNPPTSTDPTSLSVCPSVAHLSPFRSPAAAAAHHYLESLFAAMGLTTQEGKCSAGGSPTDAFEKLLSLPKGGVALAVNATGTAGALRSRATKKPAVKYYPIQGFERTQFKGYVGLMLAVQRQPVVVHIEASAATFARYDGTYKYQDPACYTGELNHVVLVVGYSVAVGDSVQKRIPPPFWIIRNSWGAGWGYNGHMRMDIQGGDGVCGINVLPGIYPIVKNILPFEAPKKAPIDILPVLPSPLALLSCPPSTTGGTAAWTCRWSSHASTNPSLPFPDPLTLLSRPSSTARGTVAVDVCGSYFKNPCAVGTCINDGKGSYSCICPPNHVPSRTIDDFPTCDPAGSLATSLAVSGSNWACADVHPLMGLTLAQFTQQNGAINCNKPLLLNAVLQLGGSPVVPCTAFFYALSGDTCESIAWSIGRSESDLLELNPGLSCQQGIKAGRSLCVERNPEFAFKVPECLKFTTLTAQDSCERLLERTGGTTSVGASAWDELYRNNPGLVCSGTVPTAASAVGSSAGVQVCLKAEYWPFTLGRCTKGRAKTVSPSLSCSGAYSFYGGTMTAAAAKFTEYNGNACAKNVGAKYMCVPR